jgi:hypothetical protein
VLGQVFGLGELGQELPGCFFVVGFIHRCKCS